MRVDVGVRVAVSDASSYVTVAGTTVPSGAKSTNVEVVIEDGAIERENNARTVVERSTDATPAVGETDVTFGPSTVVKPKVAPANGAPSAAAIPVVSANV
jgi:hypothetical protein